MMRCRNCGSDKIFLDDLRGEIKCLECGYVMYTNTMDLQPEWRYYTNEERIRRTRAEPSNGLGTRIIGHTDGKGRIISSYLQRRRLNKISLIQRKIHEYKLINYSIELERITSALKIPSYVKQYAFEIFKRIYNNKFFKHRSLYGYLGACILFACKMYKIRRNLKEIEILSKANSKDIRRCYRDIIRSGFFGKPPLSRAEDHVTLIATKLALSRRVRDLSLKILSNIKRDPRFQSKMAASLAATVTYISSVLMGERRKQADLAKAAGIAISTLRKNVSNVLKNMDIEVYIETR